MRRRWLAAVIPYGVAVLATAAAVPLRWLLDPWLGNDLPYFTFYFAVLAAAWYGGVWPGGFALLLGLLVGDYLFAEPRFSLEISGLVNQLGALRFLAVGATTCLICESLHRYRRRAQEGQERLRTTLASIGDAVIATDVECRVTTMNAVAESLTGWKQAEAVGQPLDAVFHIINEQTRKLVENPCQTVLKQGRIVGLANHTVLIARDGTERPIDDSAAPIRCKAGEIVGVVLIFRDISERRKAETALHESEARKTAMFQSALDCIISIDGKGKIVEFNAAAEQTFGYRTSQAIGKDIAELIIPPGLRDRHRQGLARYLATGASPILNRRIEMPALRADGTEFPVELTVTRAAEDPPLFTAYVRDLTAQKQAEAALRQTADALRAKEAELDLVISRTPLLLTRCSADRRYVYVNRACAEFLGRPAEEIIGRPIAEIMGAKAAAAIEPHIQRVLGGEHVEFETEIPYAERGPRFMHAIYTPHRDEQGEVIGWVASLSDITERKRAEQELHTAVQQLQIVTDSMSAPVTRCSRDLRYLWVSKPYADWIGRAAEEIVGRPIVEVIGEEAFAELRPYFQRVLAGEQVRYEEMVAFQGPGRRWVHAIYTPTHDAAGAVDGWVAVVIDIHDRRQIEERLREVDRRKDQFLAMLSHELRNPLAPIRNAVQILKMKGPPDANLQWGREVIDRQVQHMSRLLDDLLDVSRITHNKLEIRRERIDLKTVLYIAVETTRPLIDSREQKLTVELPPDPVYVEADPVRLSQVFANLLNNAAKYTDPRGQIRLGADLAGAGGQSSGEVVVSVQDNGRGIAPEMLPRVFDMFSQAERLLERSESGLGLGLSLVRTLVEMHDGRVEARSDGLGKGSEFIVRLPVALARPIQPAPPIEPIEPPEPLERRAAPKHRLLIVDDVKDSADTLAMLFQMDGHEVRTAYDGEAAIAAAEKFRPELVVLDIGMPKMNGYDVCRHIRQQPWGKKMCIVALTGWGQEDDRRRAVEAGFNHHLVKPVKSGALMQLLDGLPRGRT